MKKLIGIFTLMCLMFFTGCDLATTDNRFQCEGIEKAYYADNGLLLCETILLGQKGNRIEKTYYKNGKLALESLYENDKLNGIEKMYNEDGSIVFETPYLNDKKHGFAKVYYNGLDSQFIEILYINGEKKEDRTDKTYYKNGHLKMEESYEKGKRNGLIKYYDNDGNITYIQIYKNDHMLYEINCDEYCTVNEIWKIRDING